MHAYGVWDRRRHQIGREEKGLHKEERRPLEEVDEAYPIVSKHRQLIHIMETIRMRWKGFAIGCPDISNENLGPFVEEDLFVRGTF